MAQVIWSPAALDDLKGIAEFITRDSPSRAQVVVARLVESVDQLEHSPESGRIIPELDDADFREVLISGFRVMYQIASGAVWITGIVHGARDWTGPER